MMTSHTPVVVVSMEMAASTPTSRWHWRTAQALVLRLGLLNVNTSSIDFSDRVVLDQVLSDALISESDEAETS